MMSYGRNKPKYDGKIAGLYDLEETIGKGHYAVVKVARHVFTGEKVAVKVIDKTRLDEVSKDHLFQEVRCMKLVQHPNVVHLYEVIDTQTKLYLILELGDGGDLYDYIVKHEGGLVESEACFYFSQIVDAISYCHELHVVHRDLKPENVVFFNKLNIVKLTDFGFSNCFIPGHKLDTSCGSLAYSAPEILLGDSYDAPAVDVWSLGVILYMLVCGKPPFQEANDSETLIRIMDCHYVTPDHVSPACVDLLRGMLRRDPSERLTLSTIGLHPWLSVSPRSSIITSPAVPSQTTNHTPGKPPVTKSPLRSPKIPLVRLSTLTEDDHSYVVQKMIDGKIASRDEITQSLERNAYNHITATYFLLAERFLRKRNAAVSVPNNVGLSSSPASHTQQHQQHRVGMSNGVCTNNVNNSSNNNNNNNNNTAVTPRRTSLPVIVLDQTDTSSNPAATEPSHRDRSARSIKRCSLIEEESGEENDIDELGEENGLAVEEIRHSTSNNQLSGSKSADSVMVPPTLPSSAASPGLSPNVRPLQAVQSMPQLVLNLISEEDEEEEESNTLPPLVNVTRTPLFSTTLANSYSLSQNSKPTSTLNHGNSSLAKRRGIGASVSTTTTAAGTQTTSAAGSAASEMKQRRPISVKFNEEDEDLSMLGSNLPMHHETVRQHSLTQSVDDSVQCSVDLDTPPVLFSGMTNSLDRRLFQNSVKKEPRFGTSRSIVGAVKKSVSMILGHLSAVGDIPGSKPRQSDTWGSCSDLAQTPAKVGTSGDRATLAGKDLADRHRVAGCQLARELRQNRSERESVHQDTTTSKVRTLPSCVIRVRSRDFDSLITKFASASGNSSLQTSMSEDDLKVDSS